MSSKNTIKDNSKHPRHIAIIMDGNGRWANKRGLPRAAGHKQGAEAVRRVVEAAIEFDVQYLTLFGFSSENWNRPKPEVNELMKLLRYYLRSEVAELHKHKICIQIVGEREALDKDIVTLIENAEELTRGNKRLTLIIALNYGGRQDIAQATRALAQKHGEALQSMSDKEIARAFQSTLMTAGTPDPDMLIRTSGEQRISNFLLWQCAYAEFIFTHTLWPDFDKAALEDAIAEYAGRERRFGALQASI
jgi:undecaprenyl diphosphate synthase